MRLQLALLFFFSMDFTDIFYEKCEKENETRRKLKTKCGYHVPDKTYSFGANPR